MREARLWRNKELLQADIDLHKKQDGMGGRSISNIRAWRVILRDWPSTDLFPNKKPTRDI